MEMIAQSILFHLLALISLDSGSQFILLSSALVCISPHAHKCCKCRNTDAYPDAKLVP